jgi:hypothetical protein
LRAITTTLRPRLVVTYTTSTTGPALTLTAPSGDTSWPVSSTQQIQWHTTGTVEQVNLYYSSDGFVTSDTIASEVANESFYAWMTPAIPTTSAQVRVESTISRTTVYDVSATFRLYEIDDSVVYLPLTLGNYYVFSCTRPLTGVTIELATTRDLTRPRSPVFMTSGR